MSNPFSRRQMVGLLAAGTVFAATVSDATVEAGAVAPGNSMPKDGLIVPPYIQPGPTASEGADSKDVIWLTDAAGGNFAIEFGWDGAASRPTPVKHAAISLKAPTAEQLKKKVHIDAAEEPELQKAVPIGERAQNYVKYWATLGDLPRDTDAWYRVTSGKRTICEQKFRTCASPESTVRFVAVGDLASGKTGQCAVAYQAGLLKPDFVLALGDIVYPIGRISQYLDHYWGTYLNVTKAASPVGAPLMASTPFYSLLGNHDVDTSLNIFPDCLGIYYFFHAPVGGPGEGKWSTPLGKDQDQTARFRSATSRSFPNLAFYSFDEGPAHIAVVDSNGYCKIDSPDLLSWLEKDLTESKAKWKFVLMHAPMFHSSPPHYTEQKMRVLSPVLERCGVDVVFAGHAHTYQRSRPIRFAPTPRKPNDKLVSGTYTIDNKFDGQTHTRPDGVIHIVSGGGGGSLYKNSIDQTEKFIKDKYGDNWAPYTAKHVGDRHSLVYCELTPQKLTLRAIDQNGNEVDRAVVTKT